MISIEQIAQYLLIKINAIFDGTIESIFLTFILLSLLLISEAVIVGYKNSSLKKLTNKSNDSHIDIISSILILSNISLLLGTMMFFGVTYLLSATVKYNLNLNLLDSIDSPLISFLLFIIAIDFFNYWLHRWMHENPILWEIHKYHHSATQMTMLTVLRDHPMERALGHTINAIPTAILGLPVEQFLFISFALQIQGFLKHSNYHTNWGALGYLLQSPSTHRLHHSVNSEHHNLNYASIFQLWDILFSTSKIPSELESKKITLGLDHSFVVKHNPIKYIIQTNYDFYNKLKSIKIPSI